MSATLIVIDHYLRDYTWKYLPCITVRWTAIVVVGFSLYHHLLWLCFRVGHFPVCAR